MSDRLRLYSGLVLLVYVVGHLSNHALGIVSLATMEAGLPVTIEPWRTGPGTVLLGGAALVHMATALKSVFVRRSLRLPGWQYAQIGLGLLIPLLLAGHLIGTRGLVELFDVHGSYAFELAVLWVVAPQYGVLQVVVLVVVWSHACIGLDAWLRLKPWYARTRGLALALAVMVPTLALAGYVSAGMEVTALAADPAWFNGVFAESKAPPDALPFVETWMVRTQLGFFALFAGLALVQAGRGLLGRRARRAKITYVGRRTIDVLPGATVLDCLRAAGIPHASVCGGRSRCSTCRIHIDDGADALPAPDGEELRVLRRISAPASVRLACQLRPHADLAITPLLPPTATAADAYLRASHRASEERTIAVLFADLRGFTRIAEARLPYDVVYVLNRYRAAMADAIERAGGVVNEFVGDGIMALFGLDGEAGAACRQALAAARLMAERLDQLNVTLAAELDDPLRIGIGIHVGPVIVGEMGYANLKAITAVGDVVNTASRLEEMTKSHAAQLVVSDEVARLAGDALALAATHQVAVRGRAEPMTIRVVADAGALTP